MNHHQVHFLSLNRLIYLFLFLIGPYVNAQSDIDSLQNLLHTSQDSIKVEILIQLSKSSRDVDPNKSLSWALQGEMLAMELNNLILTGKAINARGVANYYLNEIDLSNENYFNALSIFDSIDYLPGVAKTLNNIGWNYKVKEQYDEAINYFVQGLAIAEKINDLELQQATLNNLGTVYRNTNKPEEALEIYARSLELNQKTGNKKWEAYNLNNIGLTNLDLNQFDEALTYLRQAIEINSENNFTQEYVRNLLNIGSVYIKKKNHLKADAYLDSALTIIEKNGYKRELMDSYEYRVNLNESSNNYKEALKYNKLKNALHNELNKIAWDEKVSEVEARFDLAQKAKELEIAERKLSQQKLIITAGTSFFLLLLGILFLVIKLYKTKNEWAKNIERLSEEVKQKNEELSAVNDEVQRINDNLELMVQDRTKLIKAKNNKLVKYAFINSHEVRGPLARVLGLIYLLGLEEKKLKNDNAFQLLEQATNELDDVIRKASELLRDEDFFD